MTTQASQAGVLVLKRGPEGEVPPHVNQAFVLVLTRELLTAPSRVSHVGIQVLHKRQPPRAYATFDTNYRKV